MPSIISTDGLTMAAKKEYKLDLFKQVLPALDKRDFLFYKNLSDEERKGFPSIVTLRAMSGVPDRNKDMCEYHIMAANEANKNFWNSELSKHPELQYLSMARFGTGRKVEHKWIKGPISKKVNNKVSDVLRKLYPTASYDELQMFISMNDAEDLIEIGKMFGLQKDELKDYTKEVKKVKK